jgi:UDP-N-acetyl-D-galactosamine dehydrogenase
MASYVVSRLLRLMALRQLNIVGARVLILGLTFKENCPDLRNSQVVGIVEELRQCHARIDAFDPWAEEDACEEEFGLKPIASPERGAYDAVLIAVAHAQFAALGSEAIRAFAKPGGVVFDVKGLLPKAASDERL